MKSLSWWAGWSLTILASGTFLVAGCTKQEEAEKGADTGPATSNIMAPVTTKGSLKASDDDCVGPLFRGGKPREIVFGDHRFLLDGYQLAQVDHDPDGEVIVGILSDTKENTEENRKNLKKILEFFEREKTQLIIHLGDIAGIMPLPEDIVVPEKDEKGNPILEEEKGRLRRRATIRARQDAMTKSYQGMVELLSILAESDLPVFIISGNRECKTTYNSALATLSREFPNVFNLNSVRRVGLDDLDIISMPGYHDPEYVHCPWDRCLYFESDTLSLLDLARESKKPVLVVSHGPPRQGDRNGIDVVSEGFNVGSPSLASAIEKAGVAFGAFGNIQEAGGKATNLDGSTLIAQNTFVDSLFLNPGPADSMAWSMNDGTESYGMAAVLHFVGGKASYKIYRIGTEEKETAPSPAPAPKKP